MKGPCRDVPVELRLIIVQLLILCARSLEFSTVLSANGESLGIRVEVLDVRGSLASSTIWDLTLCFGHLSVRGDLWRNVKAENLVLELLDGHL